MYFLDDYTKSDAFQIAEIQQFFLYFLQSWEAQLTNLVMTGRKWFYPLKNVSFTGIDSRCTTELSYGNVRSFFPYIMLFMFSFYSVLNVVYCDNRIKSGRSLAHGFRPRPKRWFYGKTKCCKDSLILFEQRISIDESTKFLTTGRDRIPI